MVDGSRQDRRRQVGGQAPGPCTRRPASAALRCAPALPRPRRRRPQRTVPVAGVEVRHPVLGADGAAHEGIRVVGGEVCGKHRHAVPPPLGQQLCRAWWGAGGRRRRLALRSSQFLPHPAAGLARPALPCPGLRALPPPPPAHPVLVLIADAQAAARHKVLPLQCGQPLLLRNLLGDVGGRRGHPRLGKGQRRGRGNQHKVARVDCGWTQGGVESEDGERVGLNTGRPPQHTHPLLPRHMRAAAHGSARSVTTRSLGCSDCHAPSASFCSMYSR